MIAKLLSLLQKTKSSGALIEYGLKAYDDKGFAFGVSYVLLADPVTVIKAREDYIWYFESYKPLAQTVLSDALIIRGDKLDEIVDRLAKQFVIKHAILVKYTYGENVLSAYVEAKIRR